MIKEEIWLKDYKKWAKIYMNHSVIRPLCLDIIKNLEREIENVKRIDSYCSRVMGRNLAKYQLKNRNTGDSDNQLAEVEPQVIRDKKKRVYDLGRKNKPSQVKSGVADSL